MHTSILVTVEDDIAWLAFNRPERLHALDAAMRKEIQEALRALDARDDTRAIILTGTGDKAFCVGQDLRETERLTDGDAAAEWFKAWFDFLSAIREVDKPLVAALNGVALGAGGQVAMMTDVLVGHPGVRMGMPGIDSGIPTVLGAWVLYEQLGYSRTVEITLTGRVVDSKECHRLGILHHLVPARRVAAKAKEVARLLASKPPNAMRLTKKRLREMTQAAFEDAIAAGIRISAEAYSTGEPQECMARFFAKRAERRRKGGR